MERALTRGPGALAPAVAAVGAVGADLPGHQEKAAPQILAELRSVACETRKRLLNSLDVEDQHFRAAGAFARRRPD
ncbi:hypothetical protein [Nocardia testacea]|uniref:Uncharacterized protein n=1 Tax=Nocardia testacea TaxID=248551 RepID=A0ABW7VV27_9NOCA